MKTTTATIMINAVSLLLLGCIIYFGSIWYIDKFDRRMKGMEERVEYHKGLSDQWHDASQFGTLYLSDYEHPCERMWNCSDDWKDRVAEDDTAYSHWDVPNFWRQSAEDRYHQEIEDGTIKLNKEKL